MPRNAKQSAHAELDQLRQQAAAERVRHRELQAEADAARLEVEQASSAIADGYAAEDQRAVAAARKAEETAAGKVKDLQHRLTGAEIRVQRAQADADTYLAEHARDLLDEHAVEARALAEQLTRAGHEAIRLHRAYLTMRSEIDRLVGTIPGAVPRSDGAPATYPWERQLHDLDLAIRATPELPAPLPRWAGLQNREQQDSTNRLVQLRRRKRLTDDEHAEIDQLTAGHVPAVVVVNPVEAA